MSASKTKPRFRKGQVVIWGIKPIKIVHIDAKCEHCGKVPAYRGSDNGIYHTGDLRKLTKRERGQ